jgi:CheY-like chemotaxis protein
MLEQLGHASVVVGSAEAALRMIREEPPIDLVLSDIVMAGRMDGLALARKMRDECPDLPIILATGYSQAAEQAGGDFVVLGKPYELQALRASVLRHSTRPACADLKPPPA